MLTAKLLLLLAGIVVWLFVSYLMWWRWYHKPKRWQYVIILALNLAAISLLIYSASLGGPTCESH